MIFEKSPEETEQEAKDGKKAYTCNKIVVDLKNSTFKGLDKNSSKEQIEALLGTPYSSFNYYVSKPMEEAFHGLSIDIKSNRKTSSDKFIMDNYMVRLFYSESRDTILAAEISLM